MYVTGASLLSTSMVEKFISEIENRNAIWDMKSPQYSDRLLKMKQWEEIVNLYLEPGQNSDKDKKNLENAALCDEVAKIQENILIVKDERKFLLRKVLEHENDMDSTQYYRNETVAVNGPKTKPKKKKSLDEKINAI